MATTEERKGFLRELFWSGHHHVFDEAMERLCDEAGEEWAERRDEVMGKDGPASDSIFDAWWEIHQRYRVALATIRKRGDRKRAQAERNGVTYRLDKCEREIEAIAGELDLVNPGLAAHARSLLKMIGEGMPTGVPAIDEYRPQ